MIPSFINPNIFNFSFDIILPYGGDNQEEKNCLAYGGNMEELLQRYKNYLCGEHTKYNTIENKLGSARILLRETKGIITSGSMLVFRAWANQHYSQNSRNNRINAWNQFLRWYTGDKGCPLQMKHIGFVETNQYALNEEELGGVLRAAKVNPLARLVTICLFDGALRPSEIIDIRVDRRDGNRLYLDDTKTGDKRIILSPVLQEAWADYLLVRPEPKPGHEQYLILKNYHKEAGRHYSDTHAINDMIRSIGRVAGLNQHLTPYTIRRTSATLRQCKYSRYYMGDDKLVQMLFRHKDLSTTKRYDRTSDIDIERYFDEQSREPTINRVKPTINRTVSTINGDDLQQILFIPRSDIEMNTGGEEDNNSFSFSFSFFNNDVSVTGYGGLAARDRLHCHPFISASPLTFFSDYVVWGLTGPMLSNTVPGLVRTLGGNEK